MARASTDFSYCERKKSFNLRVTNRSNGGLDKLYIFFHYCPNVTQTTSTGYDFVVFHFRNPMPEMPVK